MDWLVRLARFDFTAFDEIRADASATISAVVIVFGASVFAGIGSWLWAVMIGDISGVNRTDLFLRSLVLGSLVQTGVWFLWVYVVRWLITHLYKAQADPLELIRAMGFAFAPVSLSVLILIGGMAIPIGIFAFAVTILLSSVAVQTVSDGDGGHAMLATLLGFGVFLVFMGGFANVMEVGGLGGVAPGILFFSLDL